MTHEMAPPVTPGTKVADEPSAVPLSDGASPPGRLAVVLVCNRNYLLPTLGAALSAEYHAPADVRIVIFIVEEDPCWVQDFGPATAGTRISIRTVPLPQLSVAARLHRDRYLPPIALARLWLDDLLDADVGRFLYIDGDTMIDGSLDALFAESPPSGHLMAVPDAIAIYIDEASRNRRRDLDYLGGLSCTGADYFNSGVLYASRSAWKEIASAATSFLLTYPQLCRSSDQSALNRAARGRLALLPLRYNYQSEHMIALDPRHCDLRPIIWHFTGAPKPWEADIWPWDTGFTRFYMEATKRLGGIDIAPPVTPEAQAQAGTAHRRRAKMRLTWLYPWRRWTRRRRITRAF